MRQAGDVAWFDSASATFQGMVNQVENPFENPDGTLIPLTENAEVKDDLQPDRRRAAVDDGLSADLAQWSEDWINAFQTSEFATMLCPGWMLGVIEGNAEGVDGLGHRQRLPRRRRQLGRLVPDRSGAGRQPRGGQGARRTG